MTGRRLGPVVAIDRGEATSTDEVQVSEGPQPDGCGLASLPQALVARRLPDSLGPGAIKSARHEPPPAAAVA